MDALEEGVGDDRLHDVELQLAVVGGEGDGHIVADDLVAHLVHHFGDDGVHLAGHDRRAGLAFGQMNLVESATGTAAKQTQVVAHLVNLDGQTFQRAAILNHAAGGAGSLDEVVGQRYVPTSNLAQSADAGHAVTGQRADARADSGGAHVDDKELVGGIAQVGQLATQRSGETAKGLTQSHRHGVLQLGAPHLDNMCKLMALLVERVNHLLQPGDKLQMFQTHSHMDSAWVSIVGALRSIHHVVGRAILVFTTLVAHVFKSQVGNHLIGSHIGAGACAALNHVDGELVMIQAANQLVASPNDGITLLLGNHTHLDIGHGGSLLGDGHTLDEVVIVAQQLAADVKVLYSANGLYSIKCLFRHLTRPEQVALFTISFLFSHLMCNNRLFCQANESYIKLWNNTMQLKAID